MAAWIDNGQLTLQRLALDGTLDGAPIERPSDLDSTPLIVARGEGPEYLATWRFNLEWYSRYQEAARLWRPVTGLDYQATSYEYDGLKRLRAAIEGPGVVYTYTYDLAGNRLESWADGVLQQGLSYNAADHVEGWTYDAVGNLVDDGAQTYTFDALNRLLSSTRGVTTTENWYNGDGVLVRQELAGNPITYTQDLISPLSQILRQETATEATTHLYGHERLASMLGGARTWYLADALGSVRQVLDNSGTILSGQRYDPWGTPVEGTPAPFGFTGELYDNSSQLQYNRARWYQPATGRFVGRDPFQGLDTTPYSQHYYQYGYSDPVVNTDPSGRFVGMEQQVMTDATFASSAMLLMLVGACSSNDLLYKPASDPAFPVGQIIFLDIPEKVGGVPTGFKPWAPSEKKKFKEAKDRIKAVAGWSEETFLRAVTGGNHSLVIMRQTFGRLLTSSGYTIKRGNRIDMYFYDYAFSRRRVPNQTDNSSYWWSVTTIAHELAHAIDLVNNTDISAQMDTKIGGFANGVSSPAYPGGINKEEDFGENFAATVYYPLGEFWYTSGSHYLDQDAATPRNDKQLSRRDFIKKLFKDCLTKCSAN